MANTYTLIASNTLSSSAASVTFSSIPNTYTDLVVKFSGRSSFSTALWYILVRFNNNSSSVYSATNMWITSTASISNVRSSNSSDLLPDIEALETNGNTANTFSSQEFYIPSYASGNYKPISYFGAIEQNGTSNFSLGVVAGLFSSTSAISSISITPNAGDWISGSSFFLYGIKNS